MLKLFNKKNPKKITPLFFIIASLGALIMLPLFFVYLKFFFYTATEAKNIKQRAIIENNLKMEEKYDMSDPFITKVIDSENAAIEK
jgi:hypothetical protein